MAWWPHTPLHRLTEAGAYMVTAGTVGKEHFFQGCERLGTFHDLLLEVALKHDLRLQAWAVFSNHYHFVTTIDDARNIRLAINELHSRAAILANAWDDAAGRRVFHQYWDSHLTYERSYLARLRYTHLNPVRHGLVTDEKDYPYCSAAWFKKTAPQPFINTLAQFNVDKVNVPDDYNPL